MTFVIIAVVVVAIAVWWYLSDDDAPVKDKAKKTGSKVKVPGTLKKWGSKLSFRKKKNETPAQFKEWVAATPALKSEQLNAKTTQAFVAWLDVLSEEELKAFTQRIVNFCSGLNFELEWLLGDQLDNDQALRESLAELVLLYATVSWKAVDAQDDIKVFETFQDWKSGKQKPLTQKLFSRLVTKELIAAPSTDLFLASEKERQAYMVEAINQFAETNKEVLNTTLEEIIKADASADTNSATQEAPPASEPELASAPS